MSSENQELMARIGLLAGQINRHKNQQPGVTSAPSSLCGSRHHAGRSTGWKRGGGYGSHGFHAARTASYRHRSLVLNGAAQQSKSSENDSGTLSDASSNSSSWVTKTDRHLQLINSSVYEKEAQHRTRAIEQTRRQKQAHRDDRERLKLINHLNHVANSVGNDPANLQAPWNKYELAVQGIRFTVAKNGSKLVRVPGDNMAAEATPKMAVVGGVKFYRSKNGNLYRHGIVKAQRQSGAVKKVNEPCKLFSMTGNSDPPNKPETTSKRLGIGKCMAPANRALGSCIHGPRCRYMHDPAKVAVCKDFLQQGECLNGDSCDLSHALTPERTPTCLHFVKDNCTKSNCRYAHVKVSPAAPVCRPFGLYGYCEKGASCSERHAFECPDFSNTGVCKTKGCKLLHRERASVLRRATARENIPDYEMGDVSSDEDGESVDGDDVDSDEVDEFIGQDDTPDLGIAEQADFISL